MCFTRSARLFVKFQTLLSTPSPYFRCVLPPSCLLIIDYWRVECFPQSVNPLSGFIVTANVMQRCSSVMDEPFLLFFADPAHNHAQSRPRARLRNVCQSLTFRETGLKPQRSLDSGVPRSIGSFPGSFQCYQGPLSWLLNLWGWRRGNKSHDRAL